MGPIACDTPGTGPLSGAGRGDLGPDARRDALLAMGMVPVAAGPSGWATAGDVGAGARPFAIPVETMRAHHIVPAELARRRRWATCCPKCRRGCGRGRRWCTMRAIDVAFLKRRAGPPGWIGRRCRRGYGGLVVAAGASATATAGAVGRDPALNLSEARRDLGLPPTRRTSRWPMRSPRPNCSWCCATRSGRALTLRRRGAGEQPSVPGGGPRLVGYVSRRTTSKEARMPSDTTHHHITPGGVAAHRGQPRLPPARGREAALHPPGDGVLHRLLLCPAVLVGYFPSLMERRVAGKINLAYLFALSQFFMAWTIM